jgi:hypothetical protein
MGSNFREPKGDFIPHYTLTLYKLEGHETWRPHLSLNPKGFVVETKNWKQNSPKITQKQIILIDRKTGKLSTKQMDLKDFITNLLSTQRLEIIRRIEDNLPTEHYVTYGDNGKGHVFSSQVIKDLLADLREGNV